MLQLLEVDLVSQLLQMRISLWRIPGDVGVAGLLLGGGLSFLSAQYGLACDNVVNYEVVLADGSIVNANAKSYTDLFFALKGGGNQFGMLNVNSWEEELMFAGIVTKFTLKTYPIPPLVGLSPPKGSSTNISIGLGWNENIFWPRCLSSPKRYTELHPEQQRSKSSCHCHRLRSHRELGRTVCSFLFLWWSDTPSSCFRWVW